MKKIIFIILSVCLLLTSCRCADENTPEITSENENKTSETKIPEKTDGDIQLLSDYMYFREDVRPENIKIHFDKTENKTRFVYASFSLDETEYLSLCVFYDEDIKTCEYKKLNMSDKMYMNDGYIELNLKGKFPDESGIQYYFAGGYIINKEIGSVNFKFHNAESEKIEISGDYFTCLKTADEEIMPDGLQTLDKNNNIIRE